MRSFAAAGVLALAGVAAAAPADIPPTALLDEFRRAMRLQSKRNKA